MFYPLVSINSFHSKIGKHNLYDKAIVIPKRHHIFSFLFILIGFFKRIFKSDKLPIKPIENTIFPETSKFLRFVKTLILTQKAIKTLRSRTKFRDIKILNDRDLKAINDLAFQKNTEEEFEI